MEKDFNSSIECNSSNLRENDNEQSFVGKFKSIINSTPLSKWFRKQDNSRSTVRRRDDEDEDIICQPPSKKAKLPGDYRENNCELSFEAPVRPLLKNDIAPAAASSSSSAGINTFNCFPQPLAGPSGIRHRKILASATVTSVNQNSFSASEVFNGHNKDNTDSEGESTSGYSSVPRINSKEHVYRSQDSSKQTSPTQNSATPNNTRSLFPNSSSTMNRSLFSDKMSSPRLNTSLSSRRPSFNVSTFGSPNFMDKTLATKKIINSPFYSGRTVYGGASAYGRNLGRSAEDLQSNMKTSVRITPVNQQPTTESGDLVLGKTARRILETLEQYSSPVNDAKKIPISSKRPHRGGVFSKYIGANPYRLQDSKVVSNRELQVPSVSDLLKMKQKTRLQDSTETVRQIAKSSKSDLNTETYKLSTSDSEKEKHTGKIRNKIASVRQQKSQQANDVLNQVNLADVSLPITTLPKFDLVIPPPAATAPISKPKEKTTSSSSPTSGSSLISSSSTISINTSPVTPSTPAAIETQKTVQQMVGKQQTLSTPSPPPIEYKFSKPIVISENLKSIVACNNFKFSEPISKKSKQQEQDSSVPASKMISSTLNFKMPENKLPTLVPITNNKNNKNNGETTPIAKPASTLISTGSVMDVLGKKNTMNNDLLMDKFKPSTGSWECNSCMLRNDTDKTACVACEAPKKQQEPEQSKLDFGSKFKATSDKWECSCCLVRNDSKDTKCIACTTPKSTTSDKKDSPSGGFGNQFKMASDSWECPTCMIKNKNNLDKCAACETARPSSKDSKSATGTSTPKTSAGFVNIQTNKNGDWECPDCMVRNDSSKMKCQCCEAAKPGTNNKLESKDDSQKPTLKFAFDIDKSTAQAITFGIPPAAAASETLPKPTVNPASVFGEHSKATVATPVTFTFGIPKNVEATKSIETTATTKKPVEIQTKMPKSTASLPTGFTFGAPLSKPSVVSSKENEVGKPATASSGSEAAQKPTFTFSSPKTTAISNTATSSAVSTTSFKMPAATSITAQATSMLSFGAKPTATPLTSINTTVTEVNKLGQASSSAALFGSSKHLEAATKKPLEANKPFETAAKRPLETATKRPLETPATPASKNVFGGNNMKPGAMFSFGAQNTSSSPSSLFGGNNSSKAVELSNDDSTSNTFTTNLFAGAKPTDNSFILGGASANLAVDKPAASTFGGSLMKHPSDMSISMFGGNTKMENVSPIFGATPSKAIGKATPPAFGAAVNKQASEVAQTTTTSEIFGAAKTPAAASTFGADASKSSNSAAAAQTTFGGAAPVNNGFGNPSGGFGSSSFGSHTTTTNEVKPFTFMGDASSGEPANKAPMFSFGQSASSNAAPLNNQSGFSFGGFSASPVSAVASSSPAGGFNFTSNTTKTGDVASSFTTLQSSSSAAKNGTFNFGSAAANNNSQKVGFSFGATSNNSSTSGGFNFGAGTAAPAPSGGFNFSAATPKFDANIKPTFNFTDGTVTTFSAQPSSDGGMAMPARKIKKALRRTQR